MSRGLEAVYKLLAIDENKAVYAYSGEDFSFPYDKEKAIAYDGRIEIITNITSDFGEDFSKLIEPGKIKIVKDCYYAQKNDYGVDILALYTIKNILKKYKLTKKFPTEGHWII